MLTMSLIEQTPKTFNLRKQDHGDAAMSKDIRRSTHDNGIYLKKVAENEEAYFNDAVSELAVGYNSSPAELEAAANNILGETAEYFESSPFLNASDEILKAIDDIDDESMSEVVDDYRNIYIERQEVLANIDAESDEVALELKERAEQLQADLEFLEERAIDILNTQDNFKTEAEFGLKSKKDIRDKLAKIATIDHNPDDDPEDPDYQSPMRIRNRL
jgi:hypothetical protein